MTDPFASGCPGHRAALAVESHTTLAPSRSFVPVPVAALLLHHGAVPDKQRIIGNLRRNRHLVFRPPAMLTEQAVVSADNQTASCHRSCSSIRSRMRPRLRLPDIDTSERYRQRNRPRPRRFPAPGHAASHNAVHPSYLHTRKILFRCAQRLVRINVFRPAITSYLPRDFCKGTACIKHFSLWKIRFLLIYSRFAQSYAPYEEIATGLLLPTAALGICSCATLACQ